MPLSPLWQQHLVLEIFFQPEGLLPKDNLCWWKHTQEIFRWKIDGLGATVFRDFSVCTDSTKQLHPEIYWEYGAKKETQKNTVILLITVFYHLWVPEQTSFYQNHVKSVPFKVLCDLQA